MAGFAVTDQSAARRLLAKYYRPCGAGESFSQAAVRELAEETSLSNLRSIQPLGLSLEFSCQRTARSYREECFLALLTTLATPHIDAREHQQFRWHSTQQVVPSHYRHSSNFEAYEKALDVLATL